MGKTMDDLMSQVNTMQMGLTSDPDLQALFDSIPEVGEPVIEPAPSAVVEPPTPPAPAPVVSEPVWEPAPAPAPAPTPAPRPVEPQGKPVILDMPDKFKSDDVQEALSKAVKSYTDLESQYATQAAEVARLKSMVGQLTTGTIPQAPISATQAPVAMPTVPVEEIPDSDYFEKPNEAVGKKIRQDAFRAIEPEVKQMVARSILEYHDWNTRQAVVRDFRRTNPDFDQYVQDIVALSQVRPDIDRLPPEQSLPLLYNLAKERSKLRIETMRKDLGIPEVLPTPTPTPAPAAPAVDVATLTKQIRDSIIEEIQRRRRAAGSLGSEGTPSVSPVVRATPNAQPIQKTYSEEVFDRMLATKPIHPDDILGTARN